MAVKVGSAGKTSKRQPRKCWNRGRSAASSGCSATSTVMYSSKYTRYHK